MKQEKDSAGRKLGGALPDHCRGNVGDRNEHRSSRRRHFGGLLLALWTLLSAREAPAWITSAYTLNGGTASLTNQTIVASNVNQSAVYVLNSGKLTLYNPAITTTGATTNSDASSFYGLNAGVLASTNSSIAIQGGTITTTGSGANGVFATGTNATVTLSGVTINCSGNLGHGVDATFGGRIYVTNCTIATQKANGSVIATDRGSGTILVYGGTYSAAGTDSAGIYSTGDIRVNDAHVYSTGGEAVVIEGANSATLTNVTTSGVKGTRNRGIFIYQSMSGDATGYLGVLTMVGGSYTWPSTNGPAFYLTNTKGIVFLKDVAITNASPILLQCTTNQWGTAGANGGTAAFTAEGEVLTGNILCDSYSTNFVTLRSNSTLTAHINKAALTLDATSAWIVTSNSVLTALTNAGTIGGDYAVTNLSTVQLQGGVITASLAGTNGLVKSTAGTALACGAHTYSGATIATNGTLILSTRFAGNGNCFVTNAATLGISNQFTAASATFSNLTLGAGTTIEFLNVSNQATPLVTLSNLVLQGTNTLKILGADYLAAGCTYPLIRFAGTFTGSFSKFQLELPSGLSGTLVSNQNLISLTVAASPPAAPTGLTATAGDSKVVLGWTASTGATSYSVKRSTAAAGTYTAIATALTSLGYTNTGLSNGTTYYYVVSASNAGGESADSVWASARPVSASAPQLSSTVSSGQYHFRWPSTHLGWRLEAQTNTLATGLGTNWVTLAGSDTTTELDVPLGPTNGSVFFRLVYP